MTFKAFNFLLKYYIVFITMYKCDVYFLLSLTVKYGEMQRIKKLRMIIQCINYVSIFVHIIKWCKVTIFLNPVGNNMNNITLYNISYAR